MAQELNVNETAVNSGDAEAETEDEHDGLLHDEDFGGDTRREIFVMEFSKDGKYLAAAGRDSVIRIWKVISSPLARMEFNQLKKENGQPLRSNKRDSVLIQHRCSIDSQCASSEVIPAVCCHWHGAKIIFDYWEYGQDCQAMARRS